MSPDPKTDFKVDLTQSITPWDLKTKLKRGLWEYLVRPLYHLIPGKKSVLRVAVLRAMGARIGHGSHIQQRVRILIPWHLVVGDHVAIAHDVRILNFTTLRIDSMTVVSQYAHLCTGTHDYTHPHFPLHFEPIHIGSECWIASGAFVGPGVEIGRGCVIGANSVVTRSMPPWKVCAGNPCRPLKDRVVRSPEECG